MASVLSGRPLAYVILGWSLAKVCVDRLVGKRSGMSLFRENYDRDGLAPLDRVVRERHLQLSGCIACGLCDADEGARIAASHGAYRGVMALALASSRSLTELGAAARALEHIPRRVLRNKEAICPARLPLTALSDLVRASKASAEPGRRRFARAESERQ